MLKQFIGRRIGPVLWKDATDVITFWMNTTILPMEYTIDAFRVTIDETNNPVEIQRRNQMKVLLEVRYMRALKYIDVYNTAYDQIPRSVFQVIGRSLVSKFGELYKIKYRAKDKTLV